MQKNDYILPGMASIALAVLFPLYWIGQLNNAGSTEMLVGVWENVRSFDFSDILFLAIGLLSIYVYINLKTILNDQLNFKRIDILLLLMIGVNALLIGTLSLDLTASVVPEPALLRYQDWFVGAGLTLTVGIVIICGLLDIVIGIVLLANASTLPTLLKIFAVITLIQGLFEITVVLALTTIFIFPVALIVLAAFFLRKPESIEVV